MRQHPKLFLDASWLNFDWPVGPQICTCLAAAVAGATPWQSIFITWWRHQMETFSAKLPICAGNSLVMNRLYNGYELAYLPSPLYAADTLTPLSQGPVRHQSQCILSLKDPWLIRTKSQTWRYQRNSFSTLEITRLTVYSKRPGIVSLLFCRISIRIRLKICFHCKLCPVYRIYTIHHIATIFCARHDNAAVVECAKCNRIWIRRSEIAIESDSRWKFR